MAVAADAALAAAQNAPVENTIAGEHTAMAAAAHGLSAVQHTLLPAAAARTSWWQVLHMSQAAGALAPCTLWV